MGGRLNRFLARGLAVGAAAVLTIACGGESASPTAPGMPSAQEMASGAGMPGMGMRVVSEFDYLVQMIPHHQEAVDAAAVLARGTSRPEMRRFASAIIQTQTAEITQMRRWLAAWYPERSLRAGYRPMMRDLTGLRGDALDRAFLEDMIPHHHMAVRMSQQLVVSGTATHREVVRLAQNISDVQRKEIQMMTAWLAEWFRQG